MLISRVPEEGSGRAGDDELQASEGNPAEYTTAEEVFEIMAKNDHALEVDGDNELIARDLVILYKNIDVGTKVISNCNEHANKCPNQYVETIIYDEPASEGSNVSDISNEDLNDIFTFNRERLDLFNNIEDTLCHKLGNIEMQTSDLATEYGRHFLFNDPFIQEQLKSFHAISNSKQSDSTVLPASLLDYICCKRLEDNYNFYMDNIIKYVQRTIEQLKRISNGDYLTEKAKEKWREVDSSNNWTPKSKTTVLASSTSIPLHVEGKLNGNKSTWDDIVHSEMDIRSLSKILEKKIIVEVPKILCGSYRLFSKRCNDNLIITCKKREQSSVCEAKDNESHVDVVLKLQRSMSGHIISNIDSIMVLQPITEADSRSNEVLALELKQITLKDQTIEHKANIVELDDHHDEMSQNNIIANSLPTDEEYKIMEVSEVNYDISPKYVCDEHSQCCSTEADFSLIAADDLSCTLHRLNKQTPVLEESEEHAKSKKSPTRVRIKSPYENQSHELEEKKRKKLLEIREKREKKKIAISENCKITKNKYGRGAIMPQSSNSVTKLSITNKYFYNSIYGQTMNINYKNARKSYRNQKTEIPGIELETNDEDRCYDSPLTTPDKNSQKYVNRSYYLDEADTEVMYLQMKQNECRDETKDTFTPSTSALSTNDVGVNLNLLKQLIGTSTTEFSLTDTSSSLQNNVLFNDTFYNGEQRNTEINTLISTQSTQALVPTNTPKQEDCNDDENRKVISSVECRRSIDKVYHLIKTIETVDSVDLNSAKNNMTSNADKLDITAYRGSSTVQISDSGTSIKHQLTSSNPSCLSFEKTNTEIKVPKDFKKKQEQSSSVIPKVIISSKLQTNKIVNSKICNKESKKLTPSKITENPLKAISQLLHEFDNVQRTRHKSGHDLKRNKKPDSVTDNKSGSKQAVFKRTPRLDLHFKDAEPIPTKSLAFKERRHQGLANEPLRISQQQFQIEGNPVAKSSRKKITDIIDEVKELRGEAVRGPSKHLSRLNSLAQPKKAYVQAHQDEVQNRFGKRTLADRLHKPLPHTMSIPERSVFPKPINLRNKQKKASESFPTFTKQPFITGQHHLEKSSKIKRSPHNSPSPDGKRSPVSACKMSCNQSNTNNLPESLDGKMVAVETYVKSHFGRVPRTLVPGDKYPHKSRVPLIPTDIDLASSSSHSAEESTILGKKLHYMIDSKINTNAPVLSVLTECNESASKFPKDDQEDTFTEDLLKYDDVVSSSDYPVDIFQDKNIVTAVSNIAKSNKCDEDLDNDVNINITHTAYAQPYSSNDLQRLESALYRQVSNGVFQKRLRIKNSTLTPKQSLEKVFIWQSEDAASLVVKSTISQKKIATTDRELTILPVLSNHCVDFGFTKFPMHVATVGYAFPQHLVKCNATSKIHSFLADASTLNDIKSSMTVHDIGNQPKFNKSIQCFRGAEKQTLDESIDKQKDSSSLTDILYANLNSCEDSHDEIQCIENASLEKVVKDEPIYNSSNPDIRNKDSNNISSSTSLDILVGLLNEIKKITSRQADIAKYDNSCNIDLENKELQIILNRAAAKESSIDYSVNQVSVSSFDNSQQLETRASNFSLNLSCNIDDYRDDTNIDRNVTMCIGVPLHTQKVDKEINASVNFFRKEYVHRHTEVPSRFFPVTVSTNVTDSLIKLINKSSRQSVHSCDCGNVHNCMSLSTEIKEKPLQNTINPDDTPSIINIQYLKTNKNDKNIIIKQVIDTKFDIAVSEFDPIMKMKRDILVTVYSILVLTVFAALSFPELVNYV